MRASLNEKLVSGTGAGAEQESMGSGSGQGVRPAKGGKKGKKNKLVKVKQYFEQDIKMADAYGGVAQPRVRMVPKRFASVARQRDGVLSGQSPRGDASLKPEEMAEKAGS